MDPNYTSFLIVIGIEEEEKLKVTLEMFFSAGTKKITKWNHALKYLRQTNSQAPMILTDKSLVMIIQI